jgi:soluble lytic murein transglycosylase-like protein
VSKAALTAALTLTAARPGSADIDARKSATRALEASNIYAGPDLPLIYREKATTLIQSPTTRARRSHNTEFDEHINAAAEKHGVSVDLVRAIIQVESGFNDRAISRRGARGLMQLMPGTARDMGARNAFDPRQNIFAGVRYLRFLLDAFQGNVTLATAAYNAGPTVVKRYGGVPPYDETQDYVERVQSLIGLPTEGLAPPPALMDALLAVPGDLAALTAPDILRSWRPPRRAG